ncbi:hypothetical protein [Xanthomonas sp. XNM01]|uniref:hypothetical protein n=1 Tax=Xanthomonas sp. XNM01 TaxID=2769289 RepID=UPI0017833920|nr:hypothetical protein [Xanthomonas sp. XNM01]MBD9370440.1 hypothetical protein [Xanthomonas sp. XNM01]
MSIVALLLSLSGTVTPAIPHLHEPVVSNSGDLVSWCRQAAEARYVAAGVNTYQWAARHSDRGNMLSVEGRLRVEKRDVKVNCRIARGAHVGAITVEIDDPGP